MLSDMLVMSKSHYELLESRSWTPTDVHSLVKVTDRS
jgi:hypothetical protein